MITNENLQEAEHVLLRGSRYQVAAGTLHVDESDVVRFLGKRPNDTEFRQVTLRRDAIIGFEAAPPRRVGIELGNGESFEEALARYRIRAEDVAYVIDPAKAPLAAMDPFNRDSV